MKTSFISLGLLVMLALNSSCNSSKKSTDKGERASNLESDFDNTGFTEGRLLVGRNTGDCSYMIEVLNKDVPYFLDPFELEDKFKEDSLKVWFKYSIMRMPNRCDNANPVSISEMYLQK
tara:strand:+ start:1444 stop:1800 length:357 start_codon:yes stop_codon:yes gene_type:complete